MNKELWLALWQKNPAEMTFLTVLVLILGALFGVLAIALFGDIEYGEDELWLDF